jgi:hypothetical protein
VESGCASPDTAASVELQASRGACSRIAARRQSSHVCLTSSFTCKGAGLTPFVDRGPYAATLSGARAC